ncbi:hypothetical protein K431DRAFT_287753 [Polychaeton citri CBS 116435]|uniref:25S rRNA adenine-N(1) methyltransferase n=1 Tax=Polychaeton citri CBS 116435 TaxID=1314669 RepID=A0A9P4ULC2_9PEZI|nr:hypothetical protein K431DRAFT_287753 [Polychaeton citri CBS 116435]
MGKSKPGKQVALSSGRPPTAKKPKSNLSSRSTRTTVRAYHELNKRLATARENGDVDAARRIEDDLRKLGGLKGYQQASIQGQAKDRGGDSSILLMDWLGELSADVDGQEKLRLLEVGALSTQNACSRSGVFEVERIDLNSQSEGIKQQDFMERPLPQSRAERFDVISLSLVLNFVPNPTGRGDMLRRACEFLDVERVSSGSACGTQRLLPALFLVLPAPCTVNSRYFTESRLTEIMESLGYSLIQRKQTSKLVYSLWQLKSRLREHKSFRKEMLNDGKSRNNFTVILE